MSISWETRKYHNVSVWYGKDPFGNWDGDAHGNEWMCGYGIHKVSHGFELYEDDGEGNGTFLGRASSLEKAQELAERHADKRQDLMPAAAVK